MERFKAIARYLSLLWPPSLIKRKVKRADERGYSRGYIDGLKIGHRRGWMQMRQKVTTSPSKYPHEPEQMGS